MIMADLPTDYQNATTPKGTLDELPATGSRGINAITGRINTISSQVDLHTLSIRSRGINVKDVQWGATGNGLVPDTAALTAAFAAMTPGETLYFPPGRYMTAGGHVLNVPSCKIVGPSGRAQTYNSSAQLYLLAESNRDMLTVTANQNTFRDLTLHGNYNQQSGAVGSSRGLVTSGEVHYFLFDAVWVTSFKGDGWVIDSSNIVGGVIINSESRLNRGYGMRFNGGGTDVMMAHTYIDENEQSGIFANCGNLSMTDCHIWGNGMGSTGNLDGITFQDAAGCRLVNCDIESHYHGNGIRFKTGVNKGHIVTGCDIWDNAQQGIYAFQADHCIISNNEIRSNNWNGSGSGVLGSGVVVDGCDSMVITGNNFWSVGANRQLYGYWEEGTANTDIRFSDNMSRAADHILGGVHLGPGTIADLGSVFRRKTADQSVTNSTTIVADAHLTWPVAVGEVWEIEGVLFVDAPQAADLSVRLATSASPTGYWRMLGPAVSATSTTEVSTTPGANQFNSTDIVGTLGAGVITPIKIEGMLTVATAGIVLLLWAQGTANATPTILKQGSYLRGRRVAQ